MRYVKDNFSRLQPAFFTPFYSPPVRFAGTFYQLITTGIQARLRFSNGLQQCDAFGAMRTWNLLANSVCGKFHVTAAQDTGHFQVFGLSQSNGRFAMRARDLLAQVLDCKLDVPAASGTRHFHQPRHCVTPGS